MYILIITLVSTIGVYHPIVLKGDPPQAQVYPSYGECMEAGEQVSDWLTQDHMKVVVACEEVEYEPISK